MFYHTELFYEITVHRNCLGDEFAELVQKKLTHDVEGTCIYEHGYVITVTSIDSVTDASFHILLNDYIFYKIRFTAIVFRPFKNEVLDGLVEQTNKLGIIVCVGPLRCFISRKSMPKTLDYDGLKYTNADKTYVISVSTPVRFRVLGHRVDPMELFAIGTLLDNYLGPISPNSKFKIEQQDQVEKTNRSVVIHKV